MRTVYDTRKGPDYSPLVVHFTKDKRKMVAQKLVTEGSPLYAHKGTSGLEKLHSILETRTIYASPMPHLPNNPPAVCFSECIWEGLVDLSQKYSQYGIVFNKREIFRRGGGPALYVRGDQIKKLGSGIPAELEPFVAPFDPSGELLSGTQLDWLHEREWRLPQDLSFVDGDVEYLIVGSINDAREVIEHVGTSRFRWDQVIVMDVHKTIKQAWRTS